MNYITIYSGHDPITIPAWTWYLKLFLWLIRHGRYRFVPIFVYYWDAGYKPPQQKAMPYANGRGGGD